LIAARSAAENAVSTLPKAKKTVIRIKNEGSDTPSIYPVRPSPTPWHGRKDIDIFRSELISHMGKTHGQTNGERLKEVAKLWTMYKDSSLEEAIICAKAAFDAAA
jgi:hypothetical protein